MSKDTFESGATRNKIDVRWDLLVDDFIRDMAIVMKEGAESHGEDNWKGGVKEGVTFNHLREHLYHWLDGDRSELHMAKVAVNAMFLDWYERHGVTG